jgi:hypothetical protein
MGTASVLFLTKEDEREAEIRAVAEHEGYRFIKLRLNPKKLRRITREVRITGVKVIRAFVGGVNEDGSQAIQVSVQSGAAVFIFDRADREWTTYLLDDKEKGKGSPIGHNRDFLASHCTNGWDDSLFIMYETDDYSREVKKDVDVRAKKLKARLDSQKKADDDARVQTVEDIEREEMDLAKKKALLLGTTLKGVKQNAVHQTAGQLD